jgi:drug/metabolite transporter (DMT)-like permease
LAEKEGDMGSSDGRMDSRDWVWLVALAVLWGGSFFFNSIILKEMPPLTLVFVRVALAALMLLPVLWIQGIKFPKRPSGWTPYVAVAFFNNVVPFSLLGMGQTFLPGGMASILNATTPLFTVLVMASAGEERLYARRVIGVVTGLIGVVILRGNAGISLGGGQGVGIVLCLGAAFSYGIAALIARRYLPASPPMATASFQLLASSVMMAVLAACVDRPWQLAMPGPVTWLAMIGLAALSTALGYIIFFRILSRSGATNVMLVTLLVPVSAILLGSLVLGEHISQQEIIGALVIGSALLVIDGRVLRFFQR